MIELHTPITDADIAALIIGDRVEISGYIYTGRDAALPRLVAMIEDGSIDKTDIDLRGAVIFHTAVSPAGVGPTSSNKAEIEGSFPGLSRGGVKIHLGKGRIGAKTIRALEEYNAVYAVMPPVTALLNARTLEQRVAAFPEEGMEALHRLKVERYPCIIAAAHGKSIYDEEA